MSFPDASSQAQIRSGFFSGTHPTGHRSAGLEPAFYRSYKAYQCSGRRPRVKKAERTARRASYARVGRASRGNSCPYGENNLAVGLARKNLRDILTQMHGAIQEAVP